MDTWGLEHNDMGAEAIREVLIEHFGEEWTHVDVPEV